MTSDPCRGINIDTYFPDNDPVNSTANTNVLFVQVPPNGYASYGLQIGYEFF